MTHIKLAIYTLLAVNAVIYATAGRLSEGLDALAWFALLALFAIETRYPQWTRAPRHAVLLGLLRLIAAAAITLAALTYLQEREWLDATNAWLWIAVVAVLELGVRAPAYAARHARLVFHLSLALYGALAAVAVTWFAQGEWFDSYDAVLWITAFALIELDLLSASTRDARANS